MLLLLRSPMPLLVLALLGFLTRRALLLVCSVIGASSIRIIGCGGRRSARVRRTVGWEAQSGVRTNGVDEN